MAVYTAIAARKSVRAFQNTVYWLLITACLRTV